ncbi:hypothetical protein [Vibrio alginolyticus]|uniref:hypothetical protein n=1 Tax=Vibrio alginolyticus TaxID=663 RepID=UPI001BD2E1C5|nr:hypothetical protein [Vibrio alginolyticus]ELB2885422.1 hypothetical protein [Vibrio alginolyticus]MBS9861429.1 hypothetical protein [Vibrio alginolyticus]
MRHYHIEWLLEHFKEELSYQQILENKRLLLEAEITSLIDIHTGREDTKQFSNGRMHMIVHRLKCIGFI